MTEQMNGSEDGRDGDETEPERGDVGIGVCGDKDWFGGVNVVIAGCVSKPDAVEGVVDIVSWKNDIEELSEDKLLRDIVWVDGELFCKAEKRDEFGVSKNGAGAGRAGPGVENVGFHQGLGKAGG